MRRFLPKIASPKRNMTSRKERYGHWIFCGLICAIAGSALLSLGLHQKRLSTFRADRVAMRRKELDSGRPRRNSSTSVKRKPLEDERVRFERRPYPFREQAGAKLKRAASSGSRAAARRWI